MLKEIAPVSIKEWKKDGGHILLVPPSLYMKRYYDLNVILPEFRLVGGKRIARKTDLEGTDESKRLWIDFKKTNYDNDHFWEQDIIKELKKWKTGMTRNLLTHPKIPHPNGIISSNPFS